MDQSKLNSKSPSTDPDRVTYFAETDSRNRRVQFGIKAKDRTRHMYVIGKTGMGKSTLLENLAIQDIQNGEGIAFIDPHGKSAELLLDYIPKDRLKDVLYFAPFDLDNPISFNVMEDVGIDKRHLVVSGLMSAFKKIWLDAWSARMEYILSNTLLALLEYPGSTLLGINRMLADKVYRKKVVDNIKDPSVKSFWVDEFAKYTERFAAEATPAIQNKVGQFTSNPLIRNIIGQPHSSFDLRKMMDTRKIVIINLSKGRVGETNANLLGSMLITKIYLAAMSRADVTEGELKKLPNFYLYVDEFQSFANESFANILSEARKYNLNLTIAHQYVEQMSEEVRAAVFGNVGTMVSFRVGAIDAELLEKEFAPQFTAEDMVNLGQYQMYLKLMIDSVSSQPFSATGIPPIPKPAVILKDEVIKSSQEQFSHIRADVEKVINDWHEPDKPPPKAPSVTGALKIPLKDAAPSGMVLPPPPSAPKTSPPLSPLGVVQTKAEQKAVVARVAPQTAARVVPTVQPAEKVEKKVEANETHGQFKNDLKDLLKSFAQKEVESKSKAEEKPIARVVVPPQALASVKKEDPNALVIPGVTSLGVAKKPELKIEEKMAVKPVFSLRNDKKAPTQENLAGLRAALTAAIKPKDSAPVINNVQEVSPAHSASATIVPEIQKSLDVDKPVSLSKPPAESAPVPQLEIKVPPMARPVRIAPKVQVKAEPRVAQASAQKEVPRATRSETSAPLSTEPPKREIPYDLLEKILKGDEKK